MAIGLVMFVGAACGADPGRVVTSLERRSPTVVARADAATDASVEVEDTTVEDTSVEVEDTSVEVEVEDTSVEVEVEDTTVVDTSVEVEDDSVVVPEPDGTWAHPFEVDRWPYVVDDDTALAADSAIDRYLCASATGEAGPELVYHVRMEAAGELVAEVREADAGVDVDVHLLDALPDLATRDAACVTRHNTRLAAEVAAGEYWVVVDSYSGAAGAAGAHAGAFRLAIERTVLDTWQVVSVAPGVTWRRKVYADLAGGHQSVNSLDVDLAQATLAPYTGDACLHPSVTAPAHGAIAAVNGGFFDTGPGTCPPLDLVKWDGMVASYNHLTGAAQRAIGVDADGHAMMAWVDANTDWPEAVAATGGYPSLVTDGVIAIEPSKTSDFFVGRHPRTAVGLTASGHVLIVTVDGRGESGSGMTLNALAQHLIDLGAVDAINLDGGGSTAMWVRDQSVNGIVNSPSDDSADDHEGERGVSDLLMVVPRP